ncbi:MAG: hypothetical protein M1820_006415 [Bogoriella megaspora]|nr:MAG: hypothetical protein M1820_006415 [Bogoriella megaspora]
MLAITGASGRLGSNIVDALLNHSLIKPEELVLCTSGDASASRWDSLKTKGVHVRFADFDDQQSMIKAFTGCERLILVSTPRIQLDFGDAPHGQGREKHHFAAIEAARSAGVSHIYYTSLAFSSDSVAGVMQAHLRTEEYLQNLKKIGWSIIREGLYNESWPLYFGHFQLPNDDRKEVVIAGDGQISWTPIEDMGLGTAIVATDDPKNWAGRTFYLSSNTTRNLHDIAKQVSALQGYDVKPKIVSRDEHVEFYVKERGMDEATVKWWASTYDALKRGECDIKDDTLAKLLEGRSTLREPVEDKVRKMMG